MSLLHNQRVRYGVGVVGLILTYGLFTLSRAPVSPPPPFPLGPPPPTPWMCRDTLRHFMQASEAEYQETIQQRHAMIKKYGPTADEVESFPTHGEFYTLWDLFPPHYQCPHRLQRLGTLGDGGKYLCGLPRIATKEKCAVYSFGINSDSSFEAAILNRAPGCQVYGYDFSVSTFGPQITGNRHLARRAHFFPYGLGPVDRHGVWNNPPMYTLQSLMKENGHDFIDILKIDIEGNEFEALEVFMDHFESIGILPIGQLQLEIHATGERVYKEFPVFLKWWEKLESMGLRPFFSEANLVYMNIRRGAKPDLVEYSFINTRGNHELVAELDFHDPTFRIES
ncbi:methyltransferase domain-containing protein [Mycena crocata]|nr:methyltransferase domain-containing protein [Mycena crocata]